MSDQPQPTPYPAPSALRRLAWPLLLIGAGFLFLVLNLGLLQWGSVWRLADLWPLVLVAVGAQLIIRRSLAPRRALVATTLVIALLILTAVVHVATSTPSVPSWWPVAAGPAHTTAYSAPVGNLQKSSLTVEAGAARVEIQAGSTGDDLYRATITAPANEKPDVSVNRDTGAVTVSLPSDHFWLNGGTRMLNITVNSRLPWSLRLDTGADTGTIDLRRLHLEGLATSGGASRLDLRLPAAHGTVPLNFEGGALKVDITRPSGTAARLRMEGGANVLTADGQRVAMALGSSAEWQTSDYAGAADRYDIRLSGGASSLSLRAVS